MESNNNRKWLTKTPPTQTPEQICNDIAARLLQHANDGTITINQLIKINNLAANTAQLSSLLTLL